MENLIPIFTDITNWEKIPFINTGGTRSKKIYIQPDNDIQYFFKGSKKYPDDTFKYPMEFWSEIASSKIGQWLGFDMLDYNIGFDLNSLQQVGCLSKSMVGKMNTLTEGIEFLRGFDSRYNPVTDESRYTISFIFNSLNHYNLEKYKPNFIEMVLFDGIIGNSDRHQENWGIITDYQAAFQDVAKQLEEMNSFFGKIKTRFKKFIYEVTNVNDLREKRDKNRLSKTTLRNQSLIPQRFFSPIYDSGCCLGREFEESKLDVKLNQPAVFDKYVRDGRSEVRFENGKKPRHLEMLDHLKLEHSKSVEKTKKRIAKIYNPHDLRKIVNNLDLNLPEQLIDYKLTDSRKEMMIKLITLRLEAFLQS